MTDRERWTIYPLLFLALGIAVKDKLFHEVKTDNVLSKKLLEEMRVRPKIWRDEGGLDGREVHQGIEEALHSSAVFLAVVSAAYLESEYCNRELHSFLQQPATRFPLIVRGHKRLVTVVYDSEEELPRGGWAAAPGR